MHYSREDKERSFFKKGNGGSGLILLELTYKTIKF